MKLHVTIEPKKTTSEGVAVVNLMKDDGKRLCQLDLQYSQLAPLNNRNARAHDFLLLAACVYAIDKMVSRGSAKDFWTRKLSLTIPVSDAVLWKKARARVESCLSYLTGDVWKVNFEAASSKLVRSKNVERRLVPRPRGDVVCLFSGGLDSLIGSIDQLESSTTENVLLIGHHDPQVPGPHKDQKTLIAAIEQLYPNRTDKVLMRVGHSEKAADITMRGRSLIFIALGIVAASAIGPSIPLLIPENGTIALNVPLTPSRRGSCSTRTAHPHYLREVKEILRIIGITNPLRNPLAGKTKGESVTQCLNQKAIRELAVHSVSCAKRGRKNTWVRRTARACGRCMPCVYRRAALHAAGVDSETYGNDFCVGEVDLDMDSETGPNDLRACFSFLNRDPSAQEIAASLLASGSLEPTRLPEYADIVRRAMDEIRQLLRDKAIPDIRRRARVSK